MPAPTKEEIEELMRGVAEENVSQFDELIHDLIDITISLKHKSGGNNASRRNLMEKTMQQFLSDNQEKS